MLMDNPMAGASTERLIDNIETTNTAHGVAMQDDDTSCMFELEVAHRRTVREVRRRRGI